jgi:molybdopterin synthase catalytic subunit
MIKVTKDDFNIDVELQHLQKPSVGGIVIFVGTVRDESEGQQVNAMEIEVYPEMAEKQLNILRDEAIQKFCVEDIRVIHRYGNLKVSDNIVLVAVSARHRREAFDACKYLIDELKKRVPIWKREHTPQGARWVEVGRPD